jgi:hypothetical protein
LAEGLSPTEVGKEIAEHHEKHTDDDQHKSRALSIIEATLLAVVAVLAAWAGFASAKWGTESSLNLAKASATRTEASRAELRGLETKNYDALTFDAWFTAYAIGNPTAATVAERRFRPQFRVAFNAWLATDPLTNPKAPPGPTYMPQYVQPDQALANRLDARADAYYALGETAATNSDNYVRNTILLASVLFLVGIGGHFAVRSARIGLVVVGAGILVFSIVLLIQEPKPML